MSEPAPAKPKRSEESKRRKTGTHPQRKPRTPRRKQIGDGVVISDEITVSTVWLGLDHNFMPGSPPAIFETMVFGGKHDMWQDRYATKEAALAGHERVVAALQNGESPGE